MRSIRDRLMSAQEAVAAGFTSKGIEVRFDAKDAPCADLKNGVMHLIPLPDNLKKEDHEDIQGQCDHEMGHFLFTDPNIFLKDPFEQCILNSIEDGRIETLLSKRWFGVGENLDRSEKRSLVKIRKKARRDEVSVGSRAICGLFLLAKGRSFEHTVNAVGPDTLNILTYLKDSGVLDGIECLKSTAEAELMAISVANLLRSEGYNKPDGTGNKNESGEENGDGKESGDGESDGADSTKDDSGEKSNGGANELGDASEGETGDDDSLDNGSAGAVNVVDEDTPEADGSTYYCENPITGGYGASASVNIAKFHTKNGVAEVRRDMVAGKKFSRENYVVNTDYDSYTVLDEKVSDLESKEFFRDLKRLVPLIRRKMNMEFNAPVTRYSRHKKKGKLDTRSLWRHKHSEKMFKNRSPKLEVNTDIVLLIDVSGSMSGDKIYLAAQSAAAFSQVLDLIGVNHEVLAFTTTSHPDSQALFHNGFARVEPLSHITIKPVNKSFHSCADNFVFVGNGGIDMSNNVDGEALLWASKRLCEIQNDGSKKALVVFSDGYPAASCRGGGASLRGHLKETVKRIESAGIPVVGVGINSESVSHFYPNNVVVDDLNDLGREFLVLIRDILRKNMVTV